VDRVRGKVALVTGAARGQGRSHAGTLAREGADIIAIDICQDVETNAYALARPGELVETGRQVEALRRRKVLHQVDVRDAAGLAAAVAVSVAELSRLDIVVGHHRGVDACRDHDVDLRPSGDRFDERDVPSEPQHSQVDDGTDADFVEVLQALRRLPRCVPHCWPNAGDDCVGNPDRR